MSNVDLQRQIDELRQKVDYLTALQRPNQDLSTASGVTFGSINVGSATGAGTGEVRTSSHIRTGSGGTAQTGALIKQEVKSLADTATTQIFATNDRGWIFITDDA